MEDGVGVVITGQQEGALLCGESRHVDCGGSWLQKSTHVIEVHEQRARMYSQSSACETGEIWTRSVDCTNVNELVLLSKKLALEETR